MLLYLCNIRQGRNNSRKLEKFDKETFDVYPTIKNFLAVPLQPALKCTHSLTLSFL